MDFYCFACGFDFLDHSYTVGGQSGRYWVQMDQWQLFCSIATIRGATCPPWSTWGFDWPCCLALSSFFCIRGEALGNSLDFANSIIFEFYFYDFLYRLILIDFSVTIYWLKQWLWCCNLLVEALTPCRLEFCFLWERRYICQGARPPFHCLTLLLLIIIIIIIIKILPLLFSNTNQIEIVRKKK